MSLLAVPLQQTLQSVPTGQGKEGGGREERGRMRDYYGIYLLLCLEEGGVVSVTLVGGCGFLLSAAATYEPPHIHLTSCRVSGMVSWYSRPLTT